MSFPIHTHGVVSGEHPPLSGAGLGAVVGVVVVVLVGVVALVGQISRVVGQGAGCNHGDLLPIGEDR